ncbi:Stp1/IreP family PP2C-type Ser/Thr phosphatase [Ornithinibacillus sp. 4-3]|uniref:protein-serine/threonine phosphatase n=1 Tax=Ornithinibacillus sp. 4-3 TaxID=3231488 RepID=A0AB39HV67_9BACI
MEGQFLTDRGQVREHNEDAGGIFYSMSNQMLAIIADGMGGHQAGDVASELAVSLLKDTWQATDKKETPEQMETWLYSMINEMNTAIYNLAQEKSEYQGMGATLVIAASGDDFLTIAHIGDSRGYIYNEMGFSQLTEDHSLVNELVRTGEISQEDARVHPRKNIVLKALGIEEQVTADIRSFSFEYGDKLLLCSDGLTDKISNEELSSFLEMKKDLSVVTKELIDLANERGGEDNISVIIIQKQPSEKVGEDNVGRSPFK